MMKHFLIVCVSVMALTASVNAQRNFRGDFNGFGTDAMTLLNGYYRVTIEETATGSRNFLFDSEGDFNPKWTPESAVSFATTVTANYKDDFSGSDGSYSATSGNYYTFVLQDNGDANGEMSIHETSNAPISINRTGQEESGSKFDPSDFYSSSAVQNNVNTINITLGNAVHDEDVYVRYSTDGFVNSSFVLASGAGTAFTADIPSQDPGTTVEYYSFTTTYATPTHAGADVATLAFNDNGANGSYTTFDLGDSFHIQAQTAGGAAEDMLSGSTGGATTFNNSDTAARIYSGNVFQGVATEASDQTSLTLNFRVNGGAWNTQAGAFNNEASDDKYWLSSLDLTSISDSTVQYYLTYNYNDSETSYVFANGAGSFVSGFEVNAQANPFSFTVGSLAAAAPEPSTMALICLGGAVLIGKRRQMQRKLS